MSKRSLRVLGEEVLDYSRRTWAGVQKTSRPSCVAGAGVWTTLHLVRYAAVAGVCFPLLTSEVQ